MANDYIISKWKLWFRAIDINHKGKISRSDVRQEEDTFATLSHLNDDRRKQLQVDLDKLWDEVVFRGKSEPINEQEFVALNIRDYTANKQKFVEGIRKAYTALFDLIDVSREGSVSEEEFVNILRACGHDNIALNKKFFQITTPLMARLHVMSSLTPGYNSRHMMTVRKKTLSKKLLKLAFRPRMFLSTH